MQGCTAKGLRTKHIVQHLTNVPIKEFAYSCSDITRDARRISDDPGILLRHFIATRLSRLPPLLRLPAVQHGAHCPLTLSRDGVCYLEACAERLFWMSLRYYRNAREAFERILARVTAKSRVLAIARVTVGTRTPAHFLDGSYPGGDSRLNSIWRVYGEWFILVVEAGEEHGLLYRAATAFTLIYCPRVTVQSNVDENREKTQHHSFDHRDDSRKDAFSTIGTKDRHKPLLRTREVQRAKGALEVLEGLEGTLRVLG
ncbi:hypothetical protein P692DRAFT_20880973 [Suillus brevipes Sb2]|nr:hypothetical protein P692DRAFT_20880973 [Suillus brevipes Sb2]